MTPQQNNGGVSISQPICAANHNLRTITNDMVEITSQDNTRVGVLQHPQCPRNHRHNIPLRGLMVVHLYLAKANGP
jgi:hypothetical protein